MAKNFSISEALKFGFSATFNNIPVLFSVQVVRSIFWAAGLAFFWVLFYGFVPTYKVLSQSFFYGQGMYSFHDCFDLLSGTKVFLGSMIFTFIDTIFMAGLIKIGFEIYDEGKGKFSSLFSLWPFLMNLVALNFLYKSIVALGFLLVVIPGIMWAIQFGFAYQALVDRGLGPIESLYASSRLTKGVRIKLFGFWALVLGINLVGYLFFAVGTLITMPATLLAQIYVYRHLEK